jgi:RNA polymerase sigma-70 factor, ECF subfamily
MHVLLSGRELADALRQGNKEVFGEVFKTYYERLCNYANAFLNNMDEAEEVVQGTFLTLWEKREVIDIHTSVKSYLYQSVHNQSLNRIKHYKVRQMHASYVLKSSGDSADSVDEMVIGDELEIKINEAVHSLPDQCRRVFQLSRFENLTYAEISQQLNISVKTIENHMGKALRIMREKLKDYLPLLIWLLLRNN